MDTQHVERYIYSVVWSDEDQAYIARVAEFLSLAAHGPTADAWYVRRHVPLQEHTVRGDVARGHACST